MCGGTTCGMRPWNGCWPAAGLVLVVLLGSGPRLPVGVAAAAAAAAAFEGLCSCRIPEGANSCCCCGCWLTLGSIALFGPGPPTTGWLTCCNLLPYIGGCACSKGGHGSAPAEPFAAAALLLLSIIICGGCAESCLTPCWVRDGKHNIQQGAGNSKWYDVWGW